MAVYEFANQFSDITIDLSPMLKKYGLTFSNDQKSTVSIKNIFEFVKFNLSEIKSSNSFTTYTITNNQKPEAVANDVYGSIDYWWLVLLSNNITQPFTEWHMNNDQLFSIAEYLAEHEDMLTFEGYFNALSTINESRATIKLFKPAYIADLIQEMERIARLK